MSTKSLVQVALFAALMAVFAQIAVPLPGGVPLTLQTFGVFLTGSLLGARKAAASVLVYLLLGALGAPVFAGGRAGLGVLLGPTGGYLIGFAVGAYLLGRLTEGRRQPGYARLALGMAVALGVSYALGTAQFMLVTGFPPGVALGAAVLPFLPLDLVKLLVAAGLALRARRVLVAAGYLEGPAKAGR